jgi:hypothetical protein
VRGCYRKSRDHLIGSDITASDVSHVIRRGPVRKYVIRMRNRKLRNIRPSEGLLTGSDRKRPLSEVCSAHALFSPALFSE